VLAGGAGNDTLYGDGLIGVAAGILANAGADSNLVIGGTGPITLFQNIASGNDRLDGGRGDDVLFGGGGDDVLTGGVGVDKFIFGVGSGHDHVTDYAKGELIAINGVPGVTGLSNLSITTVNGSAVISWGTGDTITLDGYKGSKLTAADFSFGTTAAGAAGFSHTAGDLREGIGSDTYAQGISGDGASDFMTRVDGFHMTHAGDFLV